MLKQVQHDNYGLPFLIIVPLHPWVVWPTSASLTLDPRFWILIIIIPNASVIPAQAGIQDDRSPGSYFRSTDRQSRCEHATFSSSVVPLASGMLDCEPSRSSEPKAKRKQSHTSAFPLCSWDRVVSRGSDRIISLTVETADQNGGRVSPIYRKRTQVRLERDREERRQTREEEAEKKKAEHPALFEF
jgi:hypothetical protein